MDVYSIAHNSYSLPITLFIQRIKPMKKQIYKMLFLIAFSLSSVSYANQSGELNIFNITEAGLNIQSVDTPQTFSVQLTQSSFSLKEQTKIKAFLPSGLPVKGVVSRIVEAADNELKEINVSSNAKPSNEVTIVSFEQGKGSLQINKNLKLNRVVLMRLFDAKTLSYYEAKIDSASTGIFRKLDTSSIQCIELPDDTQIIKAQSNQLSIKESQKKLREIYDQKILDFNEKYNLDDVNIKHLQSRPESKHVIFINSYGGVLTNTAWNDNYNGGQPISYEPYDYNGDTSFFDEDELYRIWLGWKEMAEDYAPFDVNVTTNPLVYAATPAELRSQIIATTTVTRDSFYSATAGGVAYVGVFNRQSDYYKTGWTFNGSIGSLGPTHSHESGHQMGLRHDGTSEQGYYRGHGVWGPVMGAPFGKPYIQWSKGEYADANNTEDDLQRLAQVLGVVPDQNGDDFKASTPISFNSDYTKSLITPSGIFNDSDFYTFTLSEERLIQLNVKSELSYNLENRASNLVFKVTLYNESNEVIYDSTSPVDISPYKNDVFYIQLLKPGKYSVKVSPYFSDTGTLTGFTDYGNGGEYRIKVGDVSGPIYIEDTILNLSGEAQSEYRASFFAPSDTLFVSVDMSSDMSSGDADLYVRFKQEPIVSFNEEDWDCRPFYAGSNESCSLEDKGDNYFILVYGATEYSDVRLQYTVTSDANGDADNDGLSNALEVYIYKTNALKADSDGDGILDSVEIENGSDPLNPNEDSDGDGYSDAEEANLGSNPYDSNDVPLNITPWLRVLLKDK